MEEKEKIDIKIAMISYNRECLNIFFTGFIDDNQEQIDYINNNNKYIKLNDGTEIYGITSKEEYKYRGRRYDQILIADDKRLSTYIKQRELIKYIKDSVELSYIPYEYKIIEYI